MKKMSILFLLIFTSFILTGCHTFAGSGNIQNVGLLLDGSIDDNPWNKKGYEGLLQIEKQFRTNIFVKENMEAKEDIQRAVDELVQQGVNLIYGHSSIYGNIFEDIAKVYPDVHFVYFNGGIYDDNLTSLNFNSHAMGFFGGMIAGKMTRTDQVGIIAAFNWQPEIEGFYEGVKFENPAAVVQMNFVNSWEDKQLTLEMYEVMKSKGVDIFYPAGDYFSAEILQRAERDRLYAVGYVSDQMDVAPEAVLTSTIQNVDKLYELSAELFHKGELQGGILTFDFEDEVIELGEYNNKVPKTYQRYMNDIIKEYKKSKLLPNEYSE